MPFSGFSRLCGNVLALKKKYKFDIQGVLSGASRCLFNGGLWQKSLRKCSWPLGQIVSKADPALLNSVPKIHPWLQLELALLDCVMMTLKKKKQTQENLGK